MAVFGALVVRVALAGLPLEPPAAIAVLVLGLAAFAMAVGAVESAMARFRLDRVPQLLVAATVVAGFGLILLLR
jgi:formate hydrogenlyase subunit 4